MPPPGRPRPDVTREDLQSLLARQPHRHRRGARPDDRGGGAGADRPRGDLPRGRLEPHPARGAADRGPSRPSAEFLDDPKSVIALGAAHTSAPASKPRPPLEADTGVISGSAAPLGAEPSSSHPRQPAVARASTVPPEGSMGRSGWPRRGDRRVGRRCGTCGWRWRWRWQRSRQRQDPGRPYRPRQRTNGELFGALARHQPGTTRRESAATHPWHSRRGGQPRPPADSAVRGDPGRRRLPIGRAIRAPSQPQRCPDRPACSGELRVDRLARAWSRSSCPPRAPTWRSCAASHQRRCRTDVMCDAGRGSHGEGGTGSWLRGPMPSSRRH